jgi:hypothetical protein
VASSTAKIVKNNFILSPIWLISLDQLIINIVQVLHYIDELMRLITMNVLSCCGTMEKLLLSTLRKALIVLKAGLIGASDYHGIFFVKMMKLFAKIPVDLKFQNSNFHMIFEIS